MNIDDILDYTAKKYESPVRGYKEFVADDLGSGASFGFIQFNQKVGALPDVFKEMAKLAPAKFAQHFGAYAANLANPVWVKSANLSEEPLRSKIIASGDVPEFKQAQRNIAKRDYFDPAAKAASKHGLKSVKAHAMLFDTAVQRGEANMRSALDTAVKNTTVPPDASPEQRELAILQTFAPLADTTSRAGVVQRRVKMLSDSVLSLSPVVMGISVVSMILIAGAGYFLYKKYLA